VVRKRKMTKKIFFAKSAEVTTTPSPVLGLMKKNFLVIFIGSILIVLSIGGFFLWNYNNKKNEEKASTLFYQAYRAYKTSKAKDQPVEEPMELFRSITIQYPRTSAGALSFFYLGNCQFALKKNDESINAYNNFLKSFSSQPQLAILAYDNLGYCFEEKKDYQKALEYFQKTINPHPGLGEGGYLNVARCLEALGDKKGSLDIYKKFLLHYPDSPSKGFVQGKIQTIERKK